MALSSPMLKIIDFIYGASTEQKEWPRALEAIGKLVDGRISVFVLARPNVFLTEIVVGGDQSSVGKINSFLDQNLWFQRRHLVPANKAIVGEQLALADEVKRTRMYSEILKPNDVLSMCGCSFFTDADIWGTVTVLRSERADPFDQADIDRLDVLTPHISRAAKVATLLDGANLYAAELEAATNTFAFGLILTDDRGRVLFSNARAERALAKGSIGVRRDGRIAADSSVSGQELSAFLDRITQSRNAASLKFNGREGKTIRMIGVALPPHRRDLAVTARAAQSVILLIDESDECPSPIDLITELYRLTPAESRLVKALLGGLTLVDYADNAKITRNTIKTQIRSVFNKTETSRQSELMRRLIEISGVASFEP